MVLIALGLLALFYIYNAQGASYSDQFIGSQSIKYQALRSPYLVAQYIPLTETSREYIKRVIPRSFSLIAAKAKQYDVSLPLVLEIIRRESGFDPLVCNKKYGCKSGQGLAQLIPSTVKHCEKKLDREINPFKPEDNLDCMLWLLANEGIRHWQGYSGDYSSFVK